jgi:group I intron endonuclease
MKKLYLSGAMTGHTDLNFPAFHAEADRLRSLGYDVVNPAELNPDHSASWHACLRADLKALLDCDAICLLDGYSKSRGACLELTVALQIGLEIIYLSKKEKEGGVYEISSPSGRFYVGQTHCFDRRWLEHRRDLRAKKHHCVGLQRAWDKHGEHNIKFSPMFFVARQDRDTVEQYMLDRIGKHFLYNSALHVRTPALGTKHSEATKRKMSESHRGELNYNYGKRISDEIRQKISAAKIGKKYHHKNQRSQEHKKRLSESRKGKLVGSNNPCARPVVCLETGVVFETCTDAAKWLKNNGFPRACLSTIRKAALGKFRQAYGFHWSMPNNHLEQSQGAHLELHVAHRVGIEIFHARAVAGTA